MGRRKIPIEVITNEKSRLVTFAKRKNGLFKKAYELSILCGCEVAVLVFTPSNRLYQYSTSDMDHALRRRTQHSKASSFLTNKDLEKVMKSSNKSNSDEDGGGTINLLLDDESFDSPEEDAFILTNTSVSAMSTELTLKQTGSQKPINHIARCVSSNAVRNKRPTVDIEPEPYRKKLRRRSPSQNDVKDSANTHGVRSKDHLDSTSTTVNSNSTFQSGPCNYSSINDLRVLQCSPVRSSMVALAPCQLVYYTNSANQAQALLPIALPILPGQLPCTAVLPSATVSVLPNNNNTNMTQYDVSQGKDSGDGVTHAKNSSIIQLSNNRSTFRNASDMRTGEINQSSIPMDLTNHYQSRTKERKSLRTTSTSTGLSVAVNRSSDLPITQTSSNSTVSIYSPSQWRSRFPELPKLELQLNVPNEPTGLTADVHFDEFLPTPEVSRFICGIESEDAIINLDSCAQTSKPVSLFNSDSKSGHFTRLPCVEDDG